MSEDPAAYGASRPSIEVTARFTDLEMLHMLDAFPQASNLKSSELVRRLALIGLAAMQTVAPAQEPL